MHQFHEDNNLVGFDGGSRHLVPLMEAAGYVDIRVMGESFDNGDWRQGIALLPTIIFIRKINQLTEPLLLVLLFMRSKDSL